MAWGKTRTAASLIDGDKMKMMFLLSILVGVMAIGGVAAALFTGSSGTEALADGDSGGKGHSACQDLPSHGELKTKLVGAIGVTGGLSNEMWATVVNSDGVVCQVAKTGDDNNDQWLGSRVISPQKSNTANAFSLKDGSGGISGLALSTANLYSAVQPGGSLFGLQHSNRWIPEQRTKAKPAGAATPRIRWWGQRSAGSTSSVEVWLCTTLRVS